MNDQPPQGAARTPDEIERKIYGGEYEPCATLRKLYNSPLNAIMAIPVFKRENRILWGLLQTHQIQMTKKVSGIVGQMMEDVEVDNLLLDTPLKKLYDAYRKLSPARPDNAVILSALVDLQAKVTAATVAAEAAEDRAEETTSLVKAHLTPRPADYQVTQDQLSKMLRARNCPKDKRTIIRWEKYLSGDLENGTKPPEGYTLQTRLTLESVNAFVDFYCANEKSKLNTRISFEALTSGRNRRK